MSGWVRGHSTPDLQRDSGPRPPLLDSHVGEVKGAESRLGGGTPGAVWSLPPMGCHTGASAAPLGAKKRVFCNLYGPWMSWESKMPGPQPGLEPQG